MADRERYKRMTDLWRPGTIVTYVDALPGDDSVEPPLPGEPAVYVWVQKLNRFESEEARADADAARTRTEMLLRDMDSEEYKVVVHTSTQFDREQLSEAIVASKYAKHMAEAANSVQADKDWHDRLDVIQRTDTNDADAEELELVSTLTRTYFEEVNKRVEDRDAKERERVETLDEDVLRKEYVDGYVESRGMAVWQSQLRLGEVLFGIRTCDAVPCSSIPGHTGNDRCLEGYHHQSCDHEKLYEDYAEVRGLPDALFDKYVGAFNRVNVAAGQAKGLGSRVRSSVQSAPPSAPEDSTASTPAATSPEPGGTSA